MAIKYHGIEMKDLTKEIVEDFATMPHLRNEREKRAARIATLRQKLDDGLFFPPRWATVVFDGNMYRVNGQHSSLMLADTNGHFPKNLKVIIDRFSCETEAECALLFEQFDDRRSSRTGSEVVTAHGRVHERLDSCSATTMRYIVSGLGYALSNLNETGRPTVNDNAKLIHNHQDFALWADQYARYKTLQKAGTIAAMYATWLRNPSASDEFWSAVRDETASTPEHPTRVLAKFFAESATDGSVSGRKKWDAKAFYVKSIHAWNAWRDGVSTQLKYHPNVTPPTLK